MTCPNRIDPFDQRSQPCGDDGGYCPDCEAKVAAYWASYFGLRPDMTREQRRQQLEWFRPFARSWESR